MPSAETPTPSFFARLALAFVLFWRLLFNPELAAKVLPVSRGEGDKALPGGAREPVPARLDTVTVSERAQAPVAAKQPARKQLPPETAGLYVLGLLQREGRLIDFLKEEVAPFSDAEVGAAARVVHSGCRKALEQLVELAPVYAEPEGARIVVAAGFDAQRVQLTGNVAGQAPFHGELKHPGWVATAVHFPTLSDALDAKVLAPAEVELS